jgi:hypothetical protein
MINGNMVGGLIVPKSFVLEDENGNSFVGVTVGEETILTATDNDVRENMTYASDGGISTGTKNIPAYHTREGVVGILPGHDFAIKTLKNQCEFTKLQAIFCTNSVASDKVCINSKVYPVNSTNVLSEVTVDTDNQIVNFGLINENSNSYMIRYFTYKEEY